MKMSSTTSGDVWNKLAPTHEASALASSTTHKRPLSARVAELLADTDGPYPVWIRAPKDGPETFTGICRSKLYELAGKGLIRTASIKERYQTKGTRLFHLGSILEFIARCEEGGAK